MSRTVMCALFFATFVFTGCGAFLGQDSDSSYVRFSSESDIIDNYSISLTFTDGSSGSTYRNRDFAFSGGGIRGVGTEYSEIATSGELIVTFTLFLPDGDASISGGEFRMGLSGSHNYVAHFMADSLEANPLDNCVDCGGYYSFGIDSDTLEPDSPIRKDSLYVLWANTPR